MRRCGLRSDIASPRFDPADARFAGWFDSARLWLAARFAG
jgi:hypothetical protein